MPFPYQSIPTLSVWKSDSGVTFAIRSSDRVLQAIDGFVDAYHNPSLYAVRQETLFYLRLALLYWLKKLNAVPKNTPPTGLEATNLPNTARFAGNASRKGALTALLVIVNQELRDLVNVHSDAALADTLKAIYGADNHGVVSDQQWLHGHADRSVFLTDEGTQRRYKLRFRDGIAWRWNPVQKGYTRFDSTDNSESETNDQMVHFVMDQRGRIYAGYYRDEHVIWFKHSSLVGGANAFAAGRMKVESGIVTFVENDSGHYQPGHQHMRNLLRRLQLYGAYVGNIAVRRVSDRTTFSAAAVLSSHTSWPDQQVDD